ncbi:DUF4148 domain-containing protein [Paraburkholderia sp. LEh10]|jgi:hypothetical protein|uniref:DUF4148 domain-containing protein n=1 Tax=Paraburkholderia sp. LEh10 TaxID=2821353 RepID=UPI001AEA4B5F|nr:DUF4148 domain-containing protein [Paraburkholderia sp. LEh10]MBP0595567.1 DUF4148 domain-containing protein [Paraburkholderia sp. LEh10]
MKRQAIAVTLVMAAAAGTVAAQDVSTGPWKTREQVRAEIEQARRDGLLPYRRHDYPPSKATIARNKELYAITHSNGVTTQATPAVPAE